MSDKPQNKAKSKDLVEDKALGKPSIHPELAKESQTDAKGQKQIEEARTNKHDGSAGKSDQGDIDSIRIESIDEYGKTKIASRKDGGSEQDLLPADRSTDRPAGGFDEIHRANGGITLKGVIPGPGDKMESITTGTMKALAPENALVRDALEMRKQIDQHMEPGPEKDKVVNQLKADITASLMSGKIGENEIGGTHKAISLESPRIPDRNRDLSERIERSEESSRVSPERMQAVESATAFLVAETARLHGRDKVDALNIDKSDVGRALGTYLLTPDVANAAGEADTKKFGQMLMVFGLAPAFGLGDEAQKQISERTQETIHEGSANFLTGTAFGAILEGHPAVALSIGAVMTATFLQDQLFSPENRARNEEVLDLYSKTGNSSPEELLSFCDRSKELLGPEAYKASFDLATGGIGTPHGHAAARGIKADGGIAVGISAKAKILVRRLREIPDEAKNIIGTLLGQEPIPAFAGEASILSTNIKPAKIDDSIFLMEQSDAPISKYEEGMIDESLNRLIRFKAKTINRRESTDVVKQDHPNACTSACGQMLTEGRIKQGTLIETFKEYRHPQMRKPNQTACLEWLPKEIGDETWRYTEFNRENPEMLDLMLSQRDHWATELRTIGRDGHIVVVEGLDTNGNVAIKDPLTAERYEMSKEDFWDYWSGRTVHKELK